MYVTVMLFVMLTVIGLACTGNPAPDVTPQQTPGEQATAVSTMGPTATPNDPLPPLPTISLEQRGQSYRGTQASYCWPIDRSGQTIREVCADTVAWSGLESTVPIARGNSVSVTVEAQTPPTRLVAHIFATPDGPGVSMLELEPARSTQLPLDLGPGSYLLRISGTWPEGQVDYEFRFMLVPGGDGLVAECSYTEAEPLPLTYDVLHDPTPTGFDGRNNALCRFSKPVSRVSVLLTNGDGSRHGETFFLEPHLDEVSFPLPVGLMSEKTLELLRPGEYQRTMQVIAEDGDTWDITANLEAALRTVTVIPTPPVDVPGRQVAVGQQFTLDARETVEVATAGLLLSFNNVTQDSRCPRDVVCVRAGDATVLLGVQSPSGESATITLTIAPNGQATARFDRYDITVSDVKPQPVSTVSIDPEDYSVMVLVRVRTLSSAPTPTATVTTTPNPTATPTPLPQPTTTLSPVATSTATPTPGGASPPLKLTGTDCQAYLRLLVSSEAGEAQAVVTSYQCGSMHVDSTARYPSKTPSLVAKQGAALHLGLEALQVPTAVDVRLYSDAGISGSFFKWPEQLPGGREPVESLQPTPSLVFSFVPEAAQGDYSLVVRLIWDGQVDVFYATSLRIE